MIKRLFDLIVASASLIALSPAFLIVGLLIKADSSGPILYGGNRIGKDGVPFKMYKFRTMVVNADQIGVALTRSEDPRVTRLGRILRKWKIDEFPQLLNILRGEMSVVGPRPECPDYVRYYTPEQRQVLRVKPGMTGLTQVRYRHEETMLRFRTGRPPARCSTPATTSRRSRSRLRMAASRSCESGSGRRAPREFLRL